MSAREPEVDPAPARELRVRLTPLGRRFVPLAVAALGLAEVVAIADSSAAFSGAARAGTLLFVPLLVLFLLGLAPLLARAQLAQVEVRAPDPVTGFAGDEVPLVLRIAQRARRRAARDLIVSASHSRRGVLRPIGFVDTLGPGVERACPCSWRLLRRGHERELRLALASTFPFGLVEARLFLRVPADVLALPRLGSLRELPRIASGGAGARAARRARPPGSAELHGLREWREGESQHLVHWKVSARRGKVVLRELEGEEHAALRLILVGAVEGGEAGGRTRNDGWHEGFEQAVGLTATLADALVRRHPAVRLTFLGAREEQADEVHDRAGLASLFAFLAEVQHVAVAQSAPAAEARKAALESRRRGEVTVVVHAGVAAVEEACGGTGASVVDVESWLAGELWLPARRRPALAWST